MGIRHVVVAAALVAGLVVPLGSASAHAGLHAGVAVVDITPPNGGEALGFVRPDIPVTGVHTRLTGRALVLDDGDTEVVLLATDLAFPLDKDSVVARVADLGFTHETVLYTGTHTHSGPTELDDWQLEQLAEAIRRAHAAKVPARAGWATATVTNVNRNRSIEAHLANHGQDLFYGQGHPEDDPHGAEHTRDTTMHLLRVDQADGTPLAAWVEFPVHLTTVTPANDLWDADLAGTLLHHLAARVATPGFVGMFTNGASGDLMPRFDSYNPQALVDRHGRRLATAAFRAWRAAGERLRADVPVDVRWTRVCYCGQEVEPGRSVSAIPVWGVSFFGGSEDGASIFHEPLQTEGRRRSEALADPVHGRKIPVTVGLVHERIPEVHVLRVGERLVLAAPGEPSVEAERRFVAAVRPQLPAGVVEAVVVGLANDYMGYLTTHEEYEMQHYEGGHTVFGKWTTLLVRDTFADLVAAMTAGEPGPEPDRPAQPGGTDPGESGQGETSDAELVAAPAGRIERMSVPSLRWRGGGGGIDRPVDDAFVVLERREGGRWRQVDSDLGIALVWTESDGMHTARYDVSRALRTGTYRFVVRSGYRLETAPFEIVASDGLRLRGVTARDVGGGEVELAFHAQNPPPDPDRAVLWRPRRPSGGTITFRVADTGGSRTHVATWDPGRGLWVARVAGRMPQRVEVPAGGLVDRWGNRSGGAVTLEVGRVAPFFWPPNIGVGGGRTPGFGGDGSFPP